MLFRLQQFNKYSKTAFVFVTIVICYLALTALSKYPGQASIYILFTVVSNTLLYAGFSKNAIFFDAFVGVFFWLGYWLKLTLRIAYFNGVFHEPIGHFDRSGLAYDQALLVVICGFLGLLLARMVRSRFFFNYPNKIEGIVHWGLFRTYKNNRKAVLILFVSLVFFIAISNAVFGIYQKGSITQTFLPFGLNGVYKWLLLFGSASFSALILRFEFEINKKTSLMVMLLSLFEGFITNVSLLSRGMILNTGALLYGLLVSLNLNSIKSKFSFYLSTVLLFVILFVGSVLTVNYLRTNVYLDELKPAGVGTFIVNDQSKDIQSKNVQSMTTPLFIDRWVGMEGVMAVSSYPNLGWSLWKEAWKETYNENDTSFFDKNLIESIYLDIDTSKHHFISLPGIVAFFFYPGSFLFLFGSMFVLGGFAAAIEYCTYKLGGMNVILCSLLAQVVAYRFASFGYVPAQSYLLLGSLFLNLFIIYFAEKLTRFCND